MEAPSLRVDYTTGENINAGNTFKFDFKAADQTLEKEVTTDALDHWETQSGKSHPPVNITKRVRTIQVPAKTILDVLNQTDTWAAQADRRFEFGLMQKSVLEFNRKLKVTYLKEVTYARGRQVRLLHLSKPCFFFFLVTEVNICVLPGVMPVRILPWDWIQAAVIAISSTTL